MLDKATQKWTREPLALPSPRQKTAHAVYHDHKLFLIGGQFSGRQRVTGVTSSHVYFRIHVYDLVNRMWLNGPSMHTPRSELHPVRFRDKIIVIGGAKGAGK